MKHQHKRTLLIICPLIMLMLSSCHRKVGMNEASAYAKEIDIHRAQYKADFLADERAPLTEADFAYMHFYPADEAYDCECTFERTEDAKPFEMATVSGRTQVYTKYGIATCNINGKSVPLNIYASTRVQSMPGYRDHLFVPYKDLTSGDETYGGGRYLDLKTGDIYEGRIDIDFNKSYNPWCMYSEGYNCPIPPLENHLDVAIRAGEKTWTGEKKSH